MIVIQLNTPEEALHLQNVAALNIRKYQDHPVVGQESQQASNIRLWREISRQANQALQLFVSSEEAS